MAHIQFVEEMIREYLLFRGFSASLKVFDSEQKIDKDKCFRVDKIVEQLLQYVNTCDLNGLRELWLHLDQRMFSKLEHHFTPAVRKLENAVLKLYLVNAVASNKPDKVMDFFNKMTSELINQPEWKEWFMLPFTRYPEENPTFGVHFSRQWQDTLLVSLHNFLATIFQCMPLPALCAYEEESVRLRRLTEENDLLRARLASLAESNRGGTPVPETSVSSAPEPVPPVADLMDDFYVIAQEALSLNAESQSKTLKSLIRNIGSGLPTSPILTRRISQQTQGYKKMSGSVASEDPLPKRTPHKQRQSSVASTGVGSSSRLSPSPVPAEPAPSPQPRRSGSQSGTAEPQAPADIGERKAEPPQLSMSESSAAAPSCSFLLLSQEKYSEHRASVIQCCFNSAGSTVASCDADGVIKLWSLSPSPKTCATFVSKTSALSLAWVTKNERYILTGHKNGLVKLYDTRDNKIVWELGADLVSPLCDNSVVSLSCNPSESNFVCSVIDNQRGGAGKLLLFDLKTKKLERSVTLEPGNITASCSAFNHNGQLLFAGCTDGAVRTFDLRSNDCIDVWGGIQNEPIEGIQLSADYTACFSLARDGKLRRHCLSQRGRVLSELSVPDPCAVKTVASPHGQLFALDPTSSHALLCGPSGGIIGQIGDSNISKLLDMGGHAAAVVAVDWAYANQCATCVTASVDGQIRLSTLLAP